MGDLIYIYLPVLKAQWHKKTKLTENLRSTHFERKLWYFLTYKIIKKNKNYEHFLV